jgi:hypothetical protein
MVAVRFKDGREEIFHVESDGLYFKDGAVCLSLTEKVIWFPFDSIERMECFRTVSAPTP